MNFFRFLFFSAALLAVINQASATVAISVNGEEIPRTKILFLGFGDQLDATLKSASMSIYDRIKRNLATTDLFESVRDVGVVAIDSGEYAASVKQEAVPQHGVLEPKVTVDSTPDFEKYRAANINVLVISQFSYDESGNLRARVRMWDVLDQRQMLGKVYTASYDNYRKMANVISNEIYKAVTGESSGHFNSQIVYVAESGSPLHRTKKIRVIDFDGESNRYLTDGSDLVLTPVFAGNKDEIFYLRYLRDKAQIFSMNTENLFSKKIGGFKGTTFAASPHPKDNNLLLISAIIDGNADVYEMNIAENTARKLTKNPAIDTTASYSPDGKLIAFASDRENGQQLYVMNSDESSLKRISFGGGSYSKPVWSPDGRLIAFTKIRSNVFYIGVMNADGSNEKILTSAYLVEGARWSPNGRYLIYSKKSSFWGKSGIPRLYTIDIITGFEYEIPTPDVEGATDPDWR